MRILLTGGTGMIGRHLREYLTQLGHQVFVVTRRPQHSWEISWSSDFPAVDAAIHLAGAKVVGQRWTPKYIKELYASRIDTGRLLRSKLTDSCKLVITASGSNYYLPNGEAYDETGPAGQGELAKLCQAWESVWEGFTSARVISLRIGFVIAPDDSGIQSMLPIYRLGLGGIIGSGRQRFGWISLFDLLAIFQHIIIHENLTGPINAVAPAPVSWAQFNAAFGRALGVVTPWHIPAWAIRLILGRLADEMILADYPCIPQRLIDAGFIWQHADINSAMQAALAKE